MRPKKYLLSLLVICCSLNNACSQTEATDKRAGTIAFYGSTPGDEFIKSLLTIPADNKIDFIRWNLILNPNEWFNSVELLAARHISMEPVQYVSNIYRYYWSYQALQKYKDLREKKPSPDPAKKD